MTERRFFERTSATLEAIAHALEIADTEGQLEIDLEGGVLTIEMPNHHHYVLNQHQPTHQLWLSSPYSGAFHFCWDEKKECWIDTRHHKELLTLLQEECAHYLKLHVSF